MLIKAALGIFLLYFAGRAAGSFIIRARIEAPGSWFRLRQGLALSLAVILYFLLIHLITGRKPWGTSLASLLTFTLLVLLLNRGGFRLWPEAYLFTLITLSLLLNFIVVRAPYKYRFVQVALREEGFKFLNIFLLFLLGEVRNRRDALVAGAAVGAVFGSLENYLYGASLGFSVLALRNLLPIHLCLSSLMALLFYGSIKGRWKLLSLLAAVSVPPFIHWAYDFSLQGQTSLWPYLGLNFLLYSLLLLLSRDED